MAGPPLVTVIILAYQQPRFLNEALASVARQTHPAVEVLIVDDASGEEYTRQYALPSNGRLLINEKRLAFAAVSRNRAIREARGHYIAFLDHDDLWLPEKLTTQVAALEQNPAALMHFTHYLRVDIQGQPLPIQNPFGGVHGDLLYNLIRRKPAHIICCSSVMLRRSAFETVGLFDESIRLSADWDMWLRCAAQGHNAVLADPRPLVKYREHPAQWSRAKAAAGTLAEARVMEKALTWLPQQRPELKGLLERRLTRFRCDAARAQLAAGTASRESMTFLWRSAKIHPLNFGIYHLMWRVFRATRLRKE